MALAGGPDFALAVGLDFRAAGVRLDVGLVHGGGLEFLLDDDVGRGESGVDVTDLELEPLGDVRGLRGRRLDAAGDHVVEQQRRVGLHRFVDVDDVRQHLVIDLDQRERLLGDALADRGDGGDGVAFVQRFLARHDVAGDVPEVLRDAFGANILDSSGQGNRRR